MQASMSVSLAHTASHIFSRFLLTNYSAHPRSHLFTYTGLYGGVGITQHFLQYAILFCAFNSEGQVLWLFPGCFGQMHSQIVSSFTSTMDTRAGLPPRFRAGRKSPIDDLCSRLNSKVMLRWVKLGEGKGWYWREKLVWRERANLCVGDTTAPVMGALPFAAKFPGRAAAAPVDRGEVGVAAGVCATATAGGIIAAVGGALGRCGKSRRRAQGHVLARVSLRDSRARSIHRCAVRPHSYHETVNADSETRRLGMDQGWHR